MNPFEALAERQITGPRKSILKGVETRRMRAREKALAERNLLFREWQKWHTKKSQVFVKTYGARARKLVRFLDRMEPDDGEALIELTAQWVEADGEARWQVLQLVDHKIICLREQQGLPPFDDPVLGEPDDTLFRFIREQLR